MSSIYARLGFNSSDSLTSSTSQNLSANVLMQINTLPQLMNSWQIKDVAESNTSGYFVNPMAGTISNITTLSKNMANVSNGVIGTTIAITQLISDTTNIANTIGYSTAPGFLYHTNRQSNVIPPDSNMSEVHYQTAMGVGKSLVYIVSQSDGVTNNSPIMGNFTSLYTGNTLNTQITLANTYYNTFNTSISTAGTPPTTYLISSITLSTAQAMYNAFANLQNTMTTYRNQDNAFYQNSRAVLDDFDRVRQFNGMGQTQEDLIYNKIGSAKLLSRFNGS